MKANIPFEVQILQRENQSQHYAHSISTRGKTKINFNKQEIQLQHTGIVVSNSTVSFQWEEHLVAQHPISTLKGL